MAHEVTAHLYSKLVSNKDLEVEVRNGDGKLGTLLISKGNIEWLPSKNHVNKHQLSWTKFADLMEQEGKVVKVK